METIRQIFVLGILAILVVPTSFAGSLNSEIETNRKESFSNVMQGLWQATQKPKSQSELYGEEFDEGFQAYYKGDYSKALKIWKKLSHEGHAQAQCHIGILYEKAKHDMEKAVKWYHMASEKNNACAQAQLGEYFAFGRGSKNANWPEAAKRYLAAAEQGHRSAQWRLGTFYEMGRGVELDYEKAEEWYRLAAEQKSIGGLQGLRRIKKLKQNRAEAAKWKQLATEQNDANAQYQLGVLYHGGQGVKKDLVEAAKWFHLSADQGFSPAQNRVGILYQSGWGVEKDYKKALKWFRLAAEQGDAAAQSSIATHYELGWGVKKDREEAIKWFRLAAEQGDKTAILMLSSFKTQSH